MGLIDRRTFLKGASATAVVAVTPFSVPWAFAGVSGRADQYEAGIALAHIQTALRVVETTPGFSPPVVSRFLAYLGTALYAAIAPGMPGYRSLFGILSEFPELPDTPHGGVHWPTVANHAIGTALGAMVPAGSPAETLIASGVAEQDRNVSLPALLRRRSIDRGETIGRAVAEWGANDGGHNGHLTNFPANHTPPAGPGLWEPTPPGFQAVPLQPHWGNNRRFVHAECDASPPPAYSTDPESEFHAHAEEVYLVGQNLTAEQAEIALFWADDPGTVTPPGHSLSLTSQILEHEEASLGLAAETFFRVGCAVADAFIQCWQTKFRWNLLRPVTYIRANIDAAWSPLVTTPPFPEYNSGHSTQSAAWAEVMTALFGDGYTFTDHTHDRSGIDPRSFSSFHDAAQEAAVSRLYGGIHYRFGNESGLTVGRCVGRAAAGLRLAAG
jgi:hypothetical protein